MRRACDETEWDSDDDLDDDSDSAADEAEFEADDDELDLAPCPACRRLVVEDTPRCPHCGEWVVARAPHRRGLLFVILAIGVIIGILWIWR